MDTAFSHCNHAGMEIGLLVIVGTVFFAAGVVKGVSGMGLPTFSMALLGMVMSPIAAAALMVLPSLATNFSQCAGPHGRKLAQRLWPMWLGLALATVFASLPDLSASRSVARITLGVVLMAYGLWGLIKPALPDFGKHTLIVGCLAGAMSGLLTAATGVFVMPMVPYLQSLRLDREELIQALGLSFTVATLALTIRLGKMGVVAAAVDIAAVVIAVLTAFLGLAVGTRLRHCLQPRVFQRALYGVFLLLGLAMVGRSV
jgi:uncharacterized protein